MNRHESLAMRLAHNTKRGRRRVNVANNTVAHWDCPSDGEPTDFPIIIRFHSTDILKVYPCGLVEALSSHASFTTRQRHGEYMASGWRTFQQNSEAWISCSVGNGYHEEGWGYHPASFRMHFERGCVTGWDPKPIIDLHLRCRLGDAEAADELSAWLEEQRKGGPVPPSSGQFDGTHDVCVECGVVAMPDPQKAHVCGLRPTEAWSKMAQTVRDYRGKRYGGQYKDVREQLEAFDDCAEAGRGRWLVNESTGEMVRPLSRGDVELRGADPEAPSITIKGIRYLLADGFDYSARTIQQVRTA